MPLQTQAEFHAEMQAGLAARRRPGRQAAQPKTEAKEAPDHLSNRLAPSRAQYQSPELLSPLRTDEAVSLLSLSCSGGQCVLGAVPHRSPLQDKPRNQTASSANNHQPVPSLQISTNRTPTSAKLPPRPLRTNRRRSVLQQRGTAVLPQDTSRDRANSIHSTRLHKPSVAGSSTRALRRGSLQTPISMMQSRVTDVSTDVARQLSDRGNKAKTVLALLLAFWLISVARRLT